MTSKVEKHFDEISSEYDSYKIRNSYYYDNLKKLLAKLIPSNQKVCEIGCGTGDLLASLYPLKGVGYDISKEMIRLAKIKHKNKTNLIFTNIYPRKKFEYIFLSDVIEHIDKINLELKNIRKIVGLESKLIITMANPIWEPILVIAEKLKMKMPEGPHHRISSKKLLELFQNNGFKLLEHNYFLPIPVKIPLISYFANNYLKNILRRYSFIEFFVFKKLETN